MLNATRPDTGKACIRCERSEHQGSRASVARRGVMPVGYGEPHGRARSRKQVGCGRGVRVAVWRGAADAAARVQRDCPRGLARPCAPGRWRLDAANDPSPPKTNPPLFDIMGLAGWQVWTPTHDATLTARYVTNGQIAHGGLFLGGHNGHMIGRARAGRTQTESAAASAATRPPRSAKSCAHSLPAYATARRRRSTRCASPPSA